MIQAKIRVFVYDEEFDDRFGDDCSPDEWYAMDGDGYFDGIVPIYSEAFESMGDMTLTEEQAKYLTKDGVRIVKACIRRYGKDLDRDELQQECLLTVVKAMQKYDPSRTEAKLSTYIWAAVHNRIKALVRQSHSAQAQYERYGRRPAWKIPLEKFIDPHFEEFEEWEERKSRLTWLDNAVETLSQEERVVIQLTRAGVYQEDIARVIAKGQSSVSRIKIRALEKLTKKLKDDIR